MGRIIGEQEYKELLLDMLRRLDKICRAQGFRYFVCGGTLLGAVRHGGFIPWDDDIDLMMPREDYDALRDYMQKNEGDGLRFIDVETCPDTVYYFAKVCDTNTSLQQNHFRKVSGMGAFIDIFPMDWMPEGEEERARFREKVRRQVRLIEHSGRVSFERTASAKTNLLRAAAFLLTRPLSTRRLIRRMYKLSQRYNHRAHGSYYGLVWGRGWTHPVEDLEPYGTVMFEGMELFAPADTDAVLRSNYGDYRRLPPEEQRVKVHPVECRWIEDPAESAEE